MVIIAFCTKGNFFYYEIVPKVMKVSTETDKGETIHCMYRNRGIFWDDSVHGTSWPLTIVTIRCYFLKKFNGINVVASIFNEPEKTIKCCLNVFK